MSVWVTVQREKENEKGKRKKEMWGSKEILRLRRICARHVEISPIPNASLLAMTHEYRIKCPMTSLYYSFPPLFFALFSLYLLDILAKLASLYPY